MSFCSDSFSSDPYYRTPAAQWVLKRVTGVGVDVNVTDDLRVPCYSSQPDGCIWIRSGLSFPQYHWLMAKALFSQVFGSYSPEPFDPFTPDTRRIPRGATVVPFQRPPYASGDWRH
jgi:hypothetical protein